MEHDGHFVFDGGLCGDSADGVGGPEFFAGGAGLDVFVGWVGLYGALLFVE